MKKTIMIVLVFFVSLSFEKVHAQDFGFGIQLGEPTAITGKFLLSNTNAFQVSLGSGTFAGLRITGDYLWNFNVFNHRQFKLYAGPGAVIGLGRGNKIIVKEHKDSWYVRDDGFAVAGRGIVGVNYILKSNPVEFYVELGVLVGVIPSFGALSEGAIGVRFYF